MIGHGNMVARRQSTQQHVKVGTFREVLLAAKISALTLLQANANAEAANGGNIRKQLLKRQDSAN